MWKLNKSTKKQLEEFCNQFLANSYQEFDMLITLSIGYTVLFENQLYLENFKHLLAHADHALYRSKSLGKILFLFTKL